TAPNGTVYVIDTTSGLESITDPHGNSLTYTPDGVQSSSGLKVTISRDAQGRITSVTDPSGGVIRYGYDFYGDLVSVTDQNGNATTYTYNNDHYLLEEYDPLGRRGARNEYDDSGRLIATVDSEGNRVTYDPNLPGRQEVQMDLLGHVTVTTYDDSGNILSQTDPLGNV